MIPKWPYFRLVNYFNLPRLLSGYSQQRICWVSISGARDWSDWWHVAMHAPKNWNSPGTLLKPFAVGLQSWANDIGNSTTWSNGDRYIQGSIRSRLVSPGYTAAQFFAELLVALQAKRQPQTPDRWDPYFHTTPIRSLIRTPKNWCWDCVFMCFFVVGIDFIYNFDALRNH